MMGGVGLPLTIGFVGEFLSLAGFFRVNYLITALGGLGIILGAAYMLKLYRASFFGELSNKENKTLKDLAPRELMALVPLAALVVILGVWPKPILNPIENSVQAVLGSMYASAQRDETKTFLLKVQGGEK
jgi:NADH-quinone oxidoreductase subunit M